MRNMNDIYMKSSKTKLPPSKTSYYHPQNKTNTNYLLNHQYYYNRYCIEFNFADLAIHQPKVNTSQSSPNFHFVL